MSTFPAELSYTSFAITIISFTITVLNLIALYADFVSTIRNAPNEIRDALGNLRQQICEEREALKQQTREVRERERGGGLGPVPPPDDRRSPSRSRSPRRRRRRSHHHPNQRRSTHSEVTRLAVNYSEQTLSLHYATLGDLWRQFKTLERPFLVASGLRAEAIRHGDVWDEEDIADDKVRMDIERHGEAGSFADWRAMYKCDFAHRFIWWQSKSDVLTLANRVQRLAMMRMEREVTQTRLMIKRLLRDDLDRHDHGDPGYPPPPVWSRGEERRGTSRRREGGPSRYG